MRMLGKLQKFAKRRNRRDEAVSIAAHLAGLKKTLAGMAAVLVIAFAATFVFSEKILGWLLRLAGAEGYRIVYLSPQEILLQQFRIAGCGALLFGLPLLAVLVYGFARIALKRKERIAAGTLCIAGYALFWCGLVFAYRLMCPFMLQFFHGVNAGYDVAPAVSVENFTSLVITVFMVFGTVMELPAVCVVLALLGVLDYGAMRAAEKPAVVIMFLAAAVVTPPDAVSQLMVAVPLVLLYKISEGLVWICRRHKNK